MTVADLTEAHIGWTVRIDADPISIQITKIRADRVGPLVMQITRLRRFSRSDGTHWVGLLDARGGRIGLERIYAAETECQLLRPISAAAKRAAGAVAS